MSTARRLYGFGRADESLKAGKGVLVLDAFSGSFVSLAHARSILEARLLVPDSAFSVDISPSWSKTNTQGGTIS